MQNDLISRRELFKSLLPVETPVIDGVQYIRADVVSEKISMTPAIDAVTVVHSGWCEPWPYYTGAICRN